MTPKIRLGCEEDALKLAALAERTFRAAFADQNTASDMAAYAAEAFSLEQTARELAAPTNLFFLVEVGGEPRAYAKVRWTAAEVGRREPTDQGERRLELQRLYVDHGAIGNGLGAALMGKCLEWATAEGYAKLWLGVWEENERAISFYRRWGFEVAGSQIFRLGSDDQRDLIMERALSTAAVD